MTLSSSACRPQAWSASTRTFTFATRYCPTPARSAAASCPALHPAPCRLALEHERVHSQCACSTASPRAARSLRPRALRICPAARPRAAPSAAARPEETPSRALLLAPEGRLLVAACLTGPRLYDAQPGGLSRLHSRRTDAACSSLALLVRRQPGPATADAAARCWQALLTAQPAIPRAPAPSAVPASHEQRWEQLRVLCAPPPHASLARRCCRGPHARAARCRMRWSPAQRRPRDRGSTAADFCRRQLPPLPCSRIGPAPPPPRRARPPASRACGCTRHGYDEECFACTHQVFFTVRGQSPVQNKFCLFKIFDSHQPAAPSW